MKQPVSYWRQPPEKIYQTLSEESGSKKNQPPSGNELIRQSVIANSVALPFPHQRCGNNLGPRRFTRHCRVNQKDSGQRPLNWQSRFARIRAFVLGETWTELSSQIATLETDGVIRSQFATGSQKLRPMLEPLPSPPKLEIGFQVKEDAGPLRIQRNTSWPSSLTL